MEVGASGNEDTLPPLSVTEAAAVRAVLNAALDKLRLLGVLDTSPKLQAGPLASRSLNGRLGSLAALQQQLQARHQQLLAERVALQQAGGGAVVQQQQRSRAADNQEDINTVVAQLKDVSQAMAKRLEDAPLATNAAARAASVRHGAEALLAASVAELGRPPRTLCTLPATVTRHAQEGVAAAAAGGASPAERSQLAADLAQLRRAAEEGRSRHEALICERQAAVGEAQQWARRERERSKAELGLAEREAAAAVDAAAARAASGATMLDRRAQRLRLQASVEDCVHQALAEHLKAAAAELTEQMAGCREKAAEEGAALQAQIAAARAEAEQLDGDIKALTPLYESELALHRRREEEGGQAAAAQAHAVEAERRRHQAATQIQALFRGHAARLQLHGGGKKGKKGKRGKSKSKKGGGKKGASSGGKSAGGKNAGAKKSKKK